MTISYWTLRCVLRPEYCAKPFPHVSQTCGLEGKLISGVPALKCDILDASVKQLMPSKITFAREGFRT